MLAANRTALVTGAAGGIGAATARRLAAAGCHVFLLDRDAAGVTALAAALPRATALVHDLADPSAPAAVHAALAAESDRLDILINAAGVVLAGDDAASFARTLEINLTAAARLTLELVPLLRRSSSGRVVNVGSVQAGRAGADSVAYAASKGGLHAATRALAVDLAGDGILVNAVAPGFIDTPMAVLPDGSSEYDTDWFRSVYIEHARVPLRRPGTADEVAAAMDAFLAPESTYVTGAILAVDGGLGGTL